MREIKSCQQEKMLVVTLLLACSFSASVAAPILAQKHEILQGQQRAFEPVSNAGGTNNPASSWISRFSEDSTLSCEACKLVSDALEIYLKGKRTEEDIAKLVAQICIVLQIEDENVCDLVMEEFKVR